MESPELGYIFAWNENLRDSPISPCPACLSVCAESNFCKIPFQYFLAVVLHAFFIRNLAQDLVFVSPYFETFFDHFVFLKVP